MSKNISSNNKGLKSGIKWNSIAQLLNQASLFISGFILMRLLKPEDFGLVAIVTVFIGFSQLLSNVGLSSSIINKKKITNLDYNTVFTFSFFVGLGLAILLFFLSYPLSLFFEDSRLTILFRLAAAAILISLMGSIPSAILKRRFQFKALALSEIISVFVALTISITM